MPFAQDIARSFKGFLQRYPTEQWEVVEADSFDNASAELHGGPIRLLVLRERSQLFARVGPLGTAQWYDFDLALDAIGSGAAALQWLATDQTSLAGFALLVEEHVERLAAAFQPPLYDDFRARLAAAGKKREFRPFAI